MDKILILDFGSQVTQLIARRIRESGVYCELHPYDVDAEFIRQFAPRGIVLSGSHSSVVEVENARAPQAVFELGVPMLGICYGLQLMAHELERVVSGARAPLGEDARGATRQDDAARREGADRLGLHRAGVDLAVDAQLAQPARDELRVLRPEVEDEDLL